MPLHVPDASPIIITPVSNTGHGIVSTKVMRNSCHDTNYIVSNRTNIKPQPQIQDETVFVRILS